jgi:hypothetical protein
MRQVAEVPLIQVIGLVYGNEEQKCDALKECIHPQEAGKLDMPRRQQERHGNGDGQGAREELPAIEVA